MSMPQQKQKPSRRRPSPEPEILKIEGNWKDAMRKLISNKRPEGGGPSQRNKSAVNTAQMGGKSERDLDCVKYILPVYSPSSPRDNEEASGSRDE